MIRAVIWDLRCRNDSSGFVHNFIADKGIAYWNAGIVLRGVNNGFSLIIPVASTSNMFAGFIGADNVGGSLRIGYAPYSDTGEQNSDAYFMANYFRCKLHLSDTLPGLRFEKSAVDTKGYLNGDGAWCVDQFIALPPLDPVYKGTHCTGGFANINEMWLPEEGGGGDDGSGGFPGGGGGSTSNDEMFPGYLHNSIITDAFECIMSEEQTIAIKEGSKRADAAPFQEAQYNHMHALRSPGETVAQAVSKMEQYFVDKASIFLKTGSYIDLGMALHPIMDAYAPPHYGIQVYDGNLLSHYSELFGGLLGDEMRNASEAILDIYMSLGTTDLHTIFARWYIIYFSKIKK